MRPKNVFVLGLTDLQRGELEALPHADHYRFHGVLDVETLVDAATVDLDELLVAARADIDHAGVPVDAIVTHWDFPSSVLGPMLAHERGLPAPPLQALLACEHKYWSRLVQRDATPDHTPRFGVFDPHDDDALARLDLEPPLFVKPIKSFSSQLTRRVDDAAAFERARKELRSGGQRLAGPIEQLLDGLELPDELASVSGGDALAEQILEGLQYAPEGSVHQGKVQIHGWFDMLMHPETNRLIRLIYPSSAPAELRDRMTVACERYLAACGFDDGCFNAEFRWDPVRDRLWFVEVNTRISQSHSDLFAKVDGASNHAVAIDVALGLPPAMPKGHGPFEVAEQAQVTAPADGVVRAVPDEHALQRLRDEIPEALVEIHVQPGDRLGDGTFEHGGVVDLATVYHGASDRTRLDAQFERLAELLPFDIETATPTPPDAHASEAAPSA